MAKAKRVKSVEMRLYTQENNVVSVEVTGNCVETSYGNFAYDKLNLSNVKARLKKRDTCFDVSDALLLKMIAIIKGVMQDLRRQH